MSTSPAGTMPPSPVAPVTPARRELVIVSHCGLFYWWPVWAVGFALFVITALTGEYMVTLPPNSTGIKKAYTDDKGKPHDAWVLPADKELPKRAGNELEVQKPYVWMSTNKNLGVLFVAVLLLVIAITNIPLRGLWSVIIIVFVISLVIIFAILGWWADIFEVLNILDVRINAAGYLVISSILFVLWLVVMLVFDRQVYMVFTPGQLRVHTEIGDAEVAFDTTGMTIQKQRSDLFRHWILGLGSGDLIVKTAGAHPQEFHMPNVLFIGRKVNEIEDMLRQRTVVSGH